MTGPLDVLRVEVESASAADAESGLLAYLKITLACGLKLDGATFRRTRGGQLAVVLPGKDRGNGKRFPFVTFPGPDARAAFEAQVTAKVLAVAGKARP